MSNGTLNISEDIVKEMIAAGVPMKIIEDKELADEQRAVLYGEQLMGLVMEPKYKRFIDGQVGKKLDKEQ